MKAVSSLGVRSPWSDALNFVNTKQNVFTAKFDASDFTCFIIIFCEKRSQNFFAKMSLCCILRSVI